MKKSCLFANEGFAGQEAKGCHLCPASQKAFLYYLRLEKAVLSLVTALIGGKIE
jgi:hypothetical protein